MALQMIITIAILLIAAIFFMIGKVRADLVAISALLLLALFGILTPAEALSGFSSSVVIMMIGLFVVGGGIFQTGLAKQVSGKILKLAGANELRLLMTIMLVTAILGAFVSNTGTVAVMMPIVVSLAMSANIDPSRLLMPLAFASSMAGMLTLIGTPPNLVISDTLIGAGFDGLSFFSFTPIGLIGLTVGIIVLTLYNRIFTRKKQPQHAAVERKRLSPQALANKYQLLQNLYRLQVKQQSTVVGQALNTLDIPNLYQVRILEIRRKSSSNNPFFKTIHEHLAMPATKLEADDILYVFGTFEHVVQFKDECKLQLLDPAISERTGEHQQWLTFREVGIAEALLTPNSRLINQSIEQSGFREKYNVNILGIQRKDSYILQKLKDEKMRVGDALLVQGTWDNIARLADEHEDIVVVGQPLEMATSVTLDHKAPIAAGIMLLMVVMMVLELFPAVICVMLAAILMVMTGCLRNMETAYKTIHWESIVLIGGMIPMSQAIEKTGAATLVSEGLVTGLGSFGPFALLAGIYFATSLLTLFISNTAAAVLFAPIALASAMEMGVSPVPFLFAVATAASMCFASPFSTPPNALVMAAGRYTFIDYVRVGLPLQFVMGLVMIVCLPWLFPF